MNDKEKGEWQPIETAPKTSKSILVWCADSKCTYTATWDKDYGNGRWFHFGGGHKLIESAEPTHWRPLPDAPLAPEKPEPLELWVKRRKYSDQPAYYEAGLVREDVNTFKKYDISGNLPAVHMREVETVEPLEAGVWHVIAPALTIRLFPESKQILIRDEDEELSVVAHIEAVPDLITALQGLIEEKL